MQGPNPIPLATVSARLMRASGVCWELTCASVYNKMNDAVSRMKYLHRHGKLSHQYHIASEQMYASRMVKRRTIG